jgi:hypothetical protein
MIPALLCFTIRLLSRLWKLLSCGLLQVNIGSSWLEQDHALIMQLNVLTNTDGSAFYGCCLNLA